MLRGIMQKVKGQNVEKYRVFIGSRTWRNDEFNIWYPTYPKLRFQQLLYLKNFGF